MDKLWNSNYRKVMVANFTMSFAFYLLTPLLPLYLSETFGSTKDMIGLVLSGYTITALIFRPFSGYVVDSFPRKKVLLVCLFLYFIIFGGYLLASTLLMFAIVRTLHGGPFGASTVANNTVAIDVVPSSRRNEAIGYYGLSNNLATAIAPTIGVFVYKYVHNFDALFWLAFIVAGIGFAVDYTVKLPTKQLMKDKKAISLDRFFLLKGWVIGLNICFFGFCYGILSNYLAIYGKEVMGRLQGAKSLREGKLTHNAAEGIILSTIGYTIFIAMPNMVGYYASAILIGLGNGHMWPAMQNMIINVAQNNERGTANSTLLTSWDLGLGIGILLGGSIAEYFGYASAFWMMAVVHMAGMALFFILTKQSFLRRKRTESFT